MAPLSLILWIHILAAIAWVGGMIFITLVIVPVERGIQDNKLRYELVNKIGTRFKYLGWGGIIILITTGLYNSLQKISAWNDLVNTSYGKTLLLKLALVFIMISLSIIHDFYLGPKLVERGTEGRATNLTRFLTILARGNLFLGLLVILLAVTLRFGGVL